MHIKIKNIYLLIISFLLVNSFTGCSQKRSITIPSTFLQIYKKPPYPKTNELIGKDTANYILKIEDINQKYKINIEAIKKVIHSYKTKPSFK